MLFRCEARDMFLSPAMMIEFSFLDELFFFFQRYEQSRFLDLNLKRNNEDQVPSFTGVPVCFFLFLYFFEEVRNTYKHTAL